MTTRPVLINRPNLTNPWRHAGTAAAATKDEPRFRQIAPDRARAMGLSPLIVEGIMPSAPQHWHTHETLDAHERLLARQAAAADAEARRWPSPVPVPIPTVEAFFGGPALRTWPATGDRVWSAPAPRRPIDAVGFRLYLPKPEHHPHLVGVFDGGVQYHVREARTGPDAAPFSLTISELTSGRVALHSPTRTAAEVLLTLNLRPESLAPRSLLPAEVVGDPDALAVYVTGPAPVAIPRVLTSTELLIASLEGR